jgi:hypothetical protein
MPTDAGLTDGGGSKEPRSTDPGGDHRFQTRIALIGVAGAIIAATIGAVISLQPWSHPGPSSGSSTSRCVFLTLGNVVCASSDPEITIEFNNEANSVGCHLSAQVKWGDGAVQTFTFDGEPAGPIVLGNHKYSRKGVYAITATSNVIGQCPESFNTFPGRYSFTLD